MKLDEFAFLNQQLAGMLKAGLPLETALRQVCAGMRRQRWRLELERLQTDLSQGVPLEKAMAGRKLPALYKQMVTVGAKSNNLAGLLTLLADHYQKTNYLWTRLKGLMIYPALVLLTALGLSILLARQRVNYSALFYPYGSQPVVSTIARPFFEAGIIMPELVLGALSALALAVLIVPRLRQAARWWLPGFREAHLSRLASSLSIMTKGGVDLSSALELMRRLEPGGRVGCELAAWEREISQGSGKLGEMAKKARAIPPLFFWLVAGEGEDLGAGFARASEIFYARAAYKADLLLNSVLPISVVGLGLMIVIQIFSTVRTITGGGEFDVLNWL